MLSHLTACHMCGSSNSQFIFPVVLHDKTICPFQKNWICKDCGLVYRNPVVPALIRYQYSINSWGNENLFRDNADSTAKNIYELLEKKGHKPKTVLEIGSGHGLLAKKLQTLLPDANFLLCEPVLEIAERLTRRIPQAMVVPCGIDDLCIQGLHVDLVIVCGVDYLFPNHSATMEKLYSLLADNGIIYLERNVYTTMKGYVGYRIRSKHDLFSKNSLITVFFHPEQFEQYLMKWYNIIWKRTLSYYIDEEGDSAGYGYFCLKKGHRTVTQTNATLKSWYNENLKVIMSLTNQDSVGVKPSPRE